MTEANNGSDRWEPELGIIFSLRDDFVWATWPETDGAVRLGRHRIVAMMMEDFLAQDALGERLTNGRLAEDGSAPSVRPLDHR